jgi:endo-1,4-beta-xylanase
LVKSLQSKGIHIDGVGMQGHYDMSYPDLKELGVKVMITELDPYKEDFPNSAQQELAGRYADKISRITFWGVNAVIATAINPAPPLPD